MSQLCEVTPSDVTPRSPKEGVRTLESELQSGSARRARCARSSAGARAVAAASKGTRRTTSTSTSGHRLRLWLEEAGGSHGAPARLVSKPKGAAHALAPARQQLTQTQVSAMPEQCIDILESKMQQIAMTQAQPLGQQMDQARARFLEPSSRVRKRWKHCRRHRRPWCKRNRMWCRPKWTLDKLMQEAPLPVMPVPRVNLTLVKTLEV